MIDHFKNEKKLADFLSNTELWLEELLFEMKRLNVDKFLTENNSLEIEH